MISLLLSPILWLLKSLVLYFALIVTLELAIRCYRLFLGAKRAISAKEAILITGATSGIGLAVAKHLFSAGYSVIVGYYDSNEAGYKQLKQLVEAKSKQSEQRMIFIELDVRSQESISKAYQQCKEALKENKLHLYALVNNAGLGSLQPFAWLQRQRIKGLVETNLLGSLLMVREFLPLLIKSRGRILNVSSGLGFVPGPTYATYGVTKVAQLYFTRCMNLELKKQFQVKSIAIVPHNFIKNTNICSMNVKQNEAAWQEMKVEERQLYEQEFKKHNKLVKELESATKEQSQTKSTNRRELELRKNFFEKLMDLVRLIVDVMMAQNSASSLEQSGVPECFEDALRLETPLECMFAGDKVYQTLGAALLLCIPFPLAHHLSSSMLPQLYK